MSDGANFLIPKREFLTREEEEFQELQKKG